MKYNNGITPLSFADIKSKSSSYIIIIVDPLSSMTDRLIPTPVLGVLIDPGRLNCRVYCIQMISSQTPENSRNERNWGNNHKSEHTELKWGKAGSFTSGIVWTIAAFAEKAQGLSYC
jgi:hypothetical protein